MQTVDFVWLVGLEMKHEVLGPKSFIHSGFNILFLFCFQKLSFAECRSKKANLYSVKVEFFAYGILNPPSTKTKCCEFP